MAQVEPLPSLSSNGPLPDPQASSVTPETTFQDCTSCRIMGATTLTVLGIYTYRTGHRELLADAARIQKSRVGMLPRRVGVTAIAAAMVAAGVWRGFG